MGRIKSEYFTWFVKLCSFSTQIYSSWVDHLYKRKKNSSLKINFFSISYADFYFAVANNYSFNLLSFLIHFSHVPFYTSWKRWKHQKTRGFLRYNGFILIHWDIMDLSISYHWSISIPLENIKNREKNRGFLTLSGGTEKDQWY